jgi:hypothetical protein
MAIESLWVDPAEGWKYGFPRVYKEALDGPMSDWLIKCGYPKNMLEFPIRMWEAARDEKEENHGT